MNIHVTPDASNPFIEPFDCLRESILAAKRRSKLAVHARINGRMEEAARHQELAWSYLEWARRFHGDIDWSDE